MAVDELTGDASNAQLAAESVRARRALLSIVIAIVVVIDQITKEVALRGLANGPIDGPFGSSLRLIFNRGSAFSLGEGFGPVFGVLAILVSVSLFWVVRTVDRPIVVIGLGLIGGGAIGNVIDRAVRDGSDSFLGGAVIDFLEAASWWPVFNLADVAIVVGGFVVAFLSASD